MIGSLYVRSTRAVAFAELEQIFGSALKEHAAKHQLELGSLRAWLTHSENPPATGFFGKLLGKRSNSVDPDPWHDTFIALHPTHVVVGTHGPKRGTTVLSLPLMQASVQRGNVGMGLPGAPSDDGIRVEGFPGQVGRPGSYFVGLGPEPAANECFDAVESAVRAAKNRGGM
jgi:hypothetical protein